MPTAKGTFFPLPQVRKFVRTKEPEHKELEHGDVPDCVFPTNNSLGIPLLDVRQQAQFLDCPIRLWGTLRQAERFKGTWHFYRDDTGFDALWKAPHKVVNSRCINAVEPNFSCYDDMPRVVALFNIYRKRWISRYWQHYGINIFVDLNVSRHFQEENLMGVPKGWRAWATRAYSDRLDQVIDEFEVASAHAGTERIWFLVYSGGKKAQDLCMKYGWFWVPDHWDVAKAAKPDAFNRTPSMKYEMKRIQKAVGNGGHSPTDS